MTARRGDRWVRWVPSGPGSYDYKFAVDDTAWVRDPSHPHRGGDPPDPHSVREVPPRR